MEADVVGCVLSAGVSTDLARRPDPEQQERYAGSMRGTQAMG
jgi:hypothetical protein